VQGSERASSALQGTAGSSGSPTYHPVNPENCPFLQSGVAWSTSVADRFPVVKEVPNATEEAIQSLLADNPRLAEQLRRKMRDSPGQPAAAQARGLTASSKGVVGRVPERPRPDRTKYPVLIVVEEDSDDFMLLKRALYKSGASARVWWAHDAEEAWSTLNAVESSASGICVVMEIRMAGSDGYELLERLRSKKTACPVKFAFLTGMGDQATEARAAAMGVDGFFVKPVAAVNLIPIARTLQRLATE
jgi:CheY-like chemotaxis protein